MGAVAADAVKMEAENKLMELTPMVVQEGVGALTNKASGVDWEGWKARQASADDQLREAVMMMPFLLIGGFFCINGIRNAAWRRFPSESIRNSG